MEKQSLSQKLSHSTSNRNDDILQKKWSSTPSKNYVDPGIDFSNDPGVTDPSGAGDCDINNIVARFHKTGVLPNVKDVQSVFADVYDAPTYQDAMGVVATAHNQFSALDAKTRKKFSNNPAEFLEFAVNPENFQEMVKLGIYEDSVPTPSPASSEPVAARPEAAKPKSKPDSAPKGDES